MNPAEHTILIVDDEIDLRDAIAFDFKRKKFNVLVAESGQEALRLLDAHKVDLVLTDVRMPNGDGLELLERIKSKNVFLPVVILLTGHSDLSLEEAYDKGADAVFSKPFDRAALYEAVVRAVQSPTQRYLRKSTRVEIGSPIGLKFLKSGFSVLGKLQNLGRGGMFVRLEGKFPEISEEVEFFVETAFELNSAILGDGLVKWVRYENMDSGPSGCGIEFRRFEEGCLKDMVALINFAKTKSFIPKG